MIEQGFLKKHFVGRDGFIWWIGQVVSESEWVLNFAGRRTPTTDDHKGFDYRYKVRIMGYHPEEVADNELPWASIMLPVTAGSGARGASQSPNLSQGDFVYGFFLDGEDAQTPIIMGVLGNNQYVSILKSPSQSIFIPFSGFTNRDTVPRYGLPLENEEGKAKQSGAGSSAPTVNKTAVESNVALETRKEGASKQQLDEGKTKIPVQKTSDCEPVPLSKIQTKIKNLIADIQKIKKSASNWKTKVSTKINNIETEINKKIDEATEFISGGLKWVITEIKKFVTKQFNDSVKNTYYMIFPNQRPKLKKAIEKANDLIACLFRKIISNLLKMVGKFLLEAVDKFITTPLCAVENFVGGLIGKLTNLITSALDAIFAPIKAILGAFDLAGGILDFVIDLLSFLSCDEKPKCAEIKEWSIWDGPSSLPSVNLGALVGKVKSFAKSVKQSINPDNFDFDLDFSDVFQDSCNVGAVFCGPPQVEFFGGGGSGATGNAIISATGSILGVDIITPGSGYTDAPFINFVDSCGKGRGAVGRVRINSNGQVQDVVIEEPGSGYLTVPDGSRGGDGRVFAESGDTIVRRSDGKYDLPYSPGDTINLLPGDQVQSCSRAPYTVNEEQTIIAPYCRESTPIVPNTDAPINDQGNYPIDLEIIDIYISDPGFNYDKDDTVIVVDENNNQIDSVDLTIDTDDAGGITKVNVNRGGSGFKNTLRLYVESDTGFNAKLLPVFNVKRIGKPTQQEVLDSQTGGYIIVVDCVGKFNV